MRKFWFTLTVLICIFSSTSIFSQMQLVTDPNLDLKFSSGKSCAKCHLDIYVIWKESLHARALEDNIFQAAFMMALKEKGEAARSLCLSCHAPTTLMTKDVMLQEPLSSEAITCDFCHRLSHISPGGAGPVHITAGNEKYGPFEPADSPGSHPSVYSETFTKSDFCATCHQWTNSQGIAVLDTYREWSTGPYPAKNIHCQDCHMPAVEGKLSETGQKGKIKSHNLAGGHSITQVASAARVKVVSVSRVPSGLRAVIEVSNVGSGHMVPTGIPSRALVLEIELVDTRGVVVERQQHVFKRVILDNRHNELTSDAAIILDGAVVSKDNRIPPGGAVSIPFDFAAAPAKRYTVRATLRYQYHPLILKEEEINIEMDADSKSS